MTETPSTTDRAVSRLATITMIVALLPIAVGALTTTLHAGMAFLDWPTSDGRNMLLYPWLADLRAGRVDKFVEHGHRLAGIVIGLFGIALTVTAWRTSRRNGVRWLATAALVGIVAQGLLGGARVELDERTLAMLHGAFAAIVFSLLALTALVAGSKWSRPSEADSPAGLLPLAIAAPLAVALQYVLGGMLRHFGAAFHEHVGFALIAYGLLVAAGVAASFRGPWLRRSGIAILLLAHLQVGLGVAAFATKYGFPPAGVVAVQGTALQTAVRTGHTVVGILLFAATINLTVKVARLVALGRTATEPAGVARSRTPLVEGGVG